MECRNKEHHGSKGYSNRQHGGIEIKIKARDKFKAKELATEELERIISWINIGYSNKFEVDSGHLLLKDNSKDIYYLEDIDNQENVIKVLEIERQTSAINTMHADSPSIAQALNLLGILHKSHPASAVVVGWSAFEAILSSPGDAHDTVAEKLSRILTCSIPRSYLTSLYKSLPEKHQTSHISSNYERAKHVKALMNHLNSNEFNDIRSKIAFDRALNMHDNIKDTMTHIESHFTFTFKSLYRQRNFIVHAARTDAIALRATLRVCTPLLGAAFDRILNAHLREQVSPLKFSARTSSHLRSLMDGGDIDYLRLLESLY